MLITLTFSEKQTRHIYILRVDDHVDNVYGKHGCYPNLPPNLVVLAVDTMEPDHLLTKKVRDKCPVDLKIFIELHLEGLILANPVENINVHLVSVLEVDLNSKLPSNVFNDIWVIFLATVRALMCRIDGLLEAIVTEVVCRFRMHVAVERDDVTVLAKADTTVGHDVMCFALVIPRRHPSRETTPDIYGNKVSPAFGDLIILPSS